MIITVLPLVAEYSHFFQRFKKVSIKHILPECSVQSFDIGILHWSSRLYVFNRDRLLTAPGGKYFTCELWSIVYTYLMRLASFINDLLEDVSYFLTCDGVIAPYRK